LISVLKLQKAGSCAIFSIDPCGPGFHCEADPSIVKCTHQCIYSETVCGNGEVCFYEQVTNSTKCR